MPSNFTKLLFKSVFFHKLSNEFVQRDVLIHRLPGRGALGLRAHVAFKYITVSPGRTALVAGLDILLVEPYEVPAKSFVRR